MGLLNKLKNVLFEEEEVEIPSEDEIQENVKKPTPMKETSKKRETVKMTFDSDDDILSDRELFKAEPTFNFPAFDEKEFESVKAPIEPEVKSAERQEPVKTRTKSTSLYEMEQPIRQPRARVVPKETSRRNFEYQETRKVREVNRNENHKFVPSPVISPVYGVLDKNYKKEDIVVKNVDVKSIDVDSVRKKAFGTLEEDIEKTLNTPTREFYHEELKEEKGLDELLESSMEEVIPTKDETIMEFPSFNIEEEPMESKEKELEILDRPVRKTIEEKLEDETLENDLFDLIDSMYETREDGE